jgi:hypothetical protein
LNFIFNCRLHKDKVLSDPELLVIKDICDVLRPFSYITEKLSGERYPTLSMIMPAIGLLEKSVFISDSDSSITKKLKTELKKNMDFYFEK